MSKSLEYGNLTWLTQALWCWTLLSAKIGGSHIDASLSRQPLVKGERLVRYEVNAVIAHVISKIMCLCVVSKLLRFNS